MRFTCDSFSSGPRCFCQALVVLIDYWYSTTVFSCFPLLKMFSNRQLLALLLLMAEILHHLGWCWNPINNGKNYRSLNRWVYRISGTHQLYLPEFLYVSLLVFVAQEGSKIWSAERSKPILGSGGNLVLESSLTRLGLKWLLNQK